MFFKLRRNRVKMDSIKEPISAIYIGIVVAEFLSKTGPVLQAIEIYKECLIILNSQGQAIDNSLANVTFRVIYMKIISAYVYIKDYTSTEKYLRKLLLYIDSNDPIEEGWLHLNLADILHAQSKFTEASEFYESAIKVMKMMGNTHDQALCYAKLGVMFQSLGQYYKAREYQEKALAIKKEIGGRDEEAAIYGNLGTVFHSLGQYNKAQEYQEKALAITIEIGDKYGEAAIYGNLGTLFQSLAEYDKSRKYQEKALAIKKEIGDRKGEAKS